MKKSRKLPGFLHFLPADQRKALPWKNGKGQAHEVAISPPGSDFSSLKFSWRLSIATVAEAGPFSNFPGYDRWITPLEEKSLLLRIGKQEERIIRRGQALHFSGDEKTEAEIPNGPLLDLSFIYRREDFSAKMSLLAIGEKPKSFSIADGSLILLAVTGSFKTSVYPGEHSCKLNPQDALQIDDYQSVEERLVLIEPTDGGGIMAAIEIYNRNLI